MGYELMELTLRGLFLGVTIGLVALPISILFLTTGSIDLAVGAYAVLAAATALIVGGMLGAVAGIAVAVLASAIVGLVALRINKPGRQDPMTVVLATFGAAMCIESVVLAIYGKNPIVRQPFSELWTLFGIRFSPQVFINAGVAAVIVVGLTVSLYVTPFGRAMRASAVNPMGAVLSGFPVRMIWFSTYVIGGLLAGIGGILIMNTTGMDYSNGLSSTLGAFGAAILFGLKSPLRAFAGGLSMGVVQGWSSGYLPGAWATAIPLAFTFVVLSTGQMSRTTVAGGRA